MSRRRSVVASDVARGQEGADTHRALKVLAHHAMEETMEADRIATAEPERATPPPRLRLNKVSIQNVSESVATELDFRSSCQHIGRPVHVR